MVVWANVHGSFTLGLALGACLGAEAVLDSNDRFRTATRWAIFLAAALGAASATPYGYQPMLITFKLLSGNEALQIIGEWRPLFAHSAPINQLFVLALLFLALYYGVKIPFWRLLQILALIYGMLSHVRLAPLFSIIAPILLMGPLARQFCFLSLVTDLETNHKAYGVLFRASQKLIHLVCSFAVLALLAFCFFGPPVSPKPGITPAGAIDYIVRENLHGNIYNDYDFGGYLVFRGIKTFIDGRTDQLFSDGFIANLSRILTTEPSSFIPLLQKYDISLALVRPQSIEAKELERSPLWNKVYSDEISWLYEKRQ